MTDKDRIHGIGTLAPIIGRRAALEVLRRYPLEDILHLDRKRLLQIRHIGPRRADAILSLPGLFERLVRRPTEGMCVSCSSDVYSLLGVRLAASPREQFIVLTLSTRNRILSEDVCAVGNVNTVHVQPSEVVRQAVLRSAPCIICLHNHPSGDPTPSPEDRALTERIGQAAALLGVRMLDHIIVTSGSYYSFSDAGAL